MPAPHARPRTVNLNQLTPKTTILIRGKLSYSRLYQHIDGEELKRDQDLNRQRGLQPIDKPYTTATVYQSEVQFRNPAGVNDPSMRTAEEQYVWEHQYLSNNSPDMGWCFRAINKSRNLPEIYQYNPTTQQYDKVVLTGNMDRGLDVTLVLRIFKGSMHNNGISLDKVLVNEPIRYFSSADADLQAFGIVLNNQTAENSAPTVHAPAQTPTQAPAPAATPAPNGFAAAPTNVPPVPPAPGTGGYNAPAPGQVAPAGNSAFGAQPTQPAGRQAPVTPGIGYNPQDDPNRQY